MENVKLSAHQIRVLVLMSRLLKEKPRFAIRPVEIAKLLDSKTKSVVGTLLRMKDKGVVENVGYGAWRITELGWKVLKELGYE